MAKETTGQLQVYNRYLRRKRTALAVVCAAAIVVALYAVGVGSCWIHRAREEFESDEGRALLKQWGIEGAYEGIGHCILGYRADARPEPAPRKADYIYRVR